LGLTLAGTALAQSIVPPLGNYLIDEFGWRASFAWLALSWGGVTFIVCLLFLFDARDRAASKLKADALAGLVTVDEKVVLDLPGLTAQEASRDSALWRLAISNFIVMVLTMGLAIHMFAILTEAGVSRTNAAWLTSLGGVAGIVGKLVTGVLLDKYRPNWIGGVTLGVAALSFALLMDGIRSPTFIFVALLVNGYAAGAKTHITGFLTASYAGMKNFGAIYGVMSSLMALASGVGPMLGGLIYDHTGSYRLFLIAGAVGCVIGGLLIISMPAYPKWEKREQAVA
jgi:predicted MFS family arabinose efflux permease